MADEPRPDLPYGSWVVEVDADDDQVVIRVAPNSINWTYRKSETIWLRKIRAGRFSEGRVRRAKAAAQRVADRRNERVARAESLAAHDKATTTPEASDD